MYPPKESEGGTRDDRTGEHIVALQKGPVGRVRIVRPKSEGSRWSAKAIEEIEATPDKPNPEDPKQKEPLI